MRGPECSRISLRAIRATNASRKVGAPAAELGNVARLRDGLGLDQKPFDRAAVAERQRADRQRRRDRGDEGAEALRRQGPDLDLDFRPLAAADPQQAGLGRGLVGQREQPIVGRGARRPQEPRAERDQLAVERQAGEMRADDGDRDFAGGGAVADDVLGGERRLREAERAERQSALGMERATEAGEQRVLSRRCEKGHAERRAVVGDCSREPRCRRDRAG